MLAHRPASNTAQAGPWAPGLCGLLAGVVLVGACAGGPPSPGDGSVSGSPPATARTATPVPPAAVRAAIESYVDNLYTPAVANLRAVLVSADGRPLVQLYRGTTPARTHDVHSVTKSVTATLVGMALSEGRLRSLDETLETLLPQHRAAMSRVVAGITLRQLLTMTSGLPADPANGDPPAVLSGRDWVANVLRTGTDAPPGSRFAYSSAGSHLLAAILTRAVGSSLLDYARPRLLDPLGVDTRQAFEGGVEEAGAVARYERAAFAWPKDPTGVQLGFGTLKMAPRDLAKLGTLYLQGGRWEGRQLVPAAWVREATRAQVGTKGSSFAFSEGYGYQWWVTRERGHEAFAAVGFGGQLVEVVPDLRLVFVTVAEAAEPNLRWEHLRGLVAGVVVPMVGG